MTSLHDKQSDKQLHGYLAYAELSQVQRAAQATSEFGLPHGQTRAHQIDLGGPGKHGG